jgi:hypothetical protein
MKVSSNIDIGALQSASLTKSAHEIFSAFNSLNRNRLPEARR